VIDGSRFVRLDDPGAAAPGPTPTAAGLAVDQEDEHGNGATVIGV